MFEVLAMTMKPIYWLTIVVVCFLTAWLRFAPIQNYNFAFTYDQGRDIVEVRSIVAGKRPILVGPTTSINGVFLGPFYFYWNVIPFVLWQGDPTGILYWQIIWYQLAGLGIAWYFRQRKRAFGLISAILFFLMPIGFYTSRYAWNANTMPAMTAWWLLYSWWAMEKPTKWKLFGWGIISGLGMQVDAAFGVVYFPATLLLLLTNPPSYFERGLGGVRTKYLIFTIFGFGITLFPQIAYELKHSWSMTKIFMDQVTGKNSILGASLTWGERLVDRYDAFLRLIHDTSHLHPWVAEILVGVSLAFSLVWVLNSASSSRQRPGSMVGIFRKVWGYLKSFDLTSTKDPHSYLTEPLKAVLKSCLVLLVVSLILYLIFPQPLKVWYIDGLAVPLVLITAGLLSALWSYPQGDSHSYFKRGLGGVKPEWLFKTAILVILIWTTLSTIQAQGQYIKDSRQPSDNVSQLKNQMRVVDRVYQQAGGEGFTVYNYVPQIYDYTYNYIFWWYGKKYYGYQPAKITYADDVPEYVKSNQKLWGASKEVDQNSPVFIIIEPELQFPERLSAWLNQFQNYCVSDEIKFAWGTQVKQLQMCDPNYISHLTSKPNYLK